MININSVVLSVIACLEDKSITQKINDSYEFKLKKLTHYKDYLNSKEIKYKIVDESNFNKCLDFVIKNLTDSNFKDFVKRNDIFSVTFKKKETIVSNEGICTGDIAINSLKSLIKKYSIDNGILHICVDPIYSHKQQVLLNKELLLGCFNNEGHLVSNIEVKFINEGIILDEFSEKLIEAGFVLQKK